MEAGRDSQAEVLGIHRVAYTRGMVAYRAGLLVCRERWDKTKPEFLND